MLTCEISILKFSWALRTHLYAYKRGLIRKPNKSELIIELRSMITKNIPTHLPPTDHHRNMVIDLMACTRKVSIEKQNLKTCNDFFVNLWSTFSFLFKSCNRVDIVFDVYKENSIKASERRQRTTGEGKETIISGFDQFLLVEIDRFWSVSKNKTALQLFTQSGYSARLKVNNWIKPLFLGGSHKENDAMCVSFVSGLVSVEKLLEFTREEDDNRIFSMQTTQ